MTTMKFDWDKYKPIPGFDCVKMKNEIQAKVLKATEGMTTEEVLEYFRKGSEEFQDEINRIRHRQKELIVMDN